MTEACFQIRKVILSPQADTPKHGGFRKYNTDVSQLFVLGLRRRVIWYWLETSELIFKFIIRFSLYWNTGMVELPNLSWYIIDARAAFDLKAC